MRVCHMLMKMAHDMVNETTKDMANQLMISSIMVFATIIVGRH